MAAAGSFDKTQLQKLFAGKVARSWAWIGELEEGVSGSASPQDLELWFQSIHLLFTQPRKDPRAFAAWKQRTLESTRKKRLRPERAFFEDFSAFASKKHLRRLPTTERAINQVDLDKALAVYKERFSDASDFTFVFVGNVDLKTFQPLVETVSCQACRP